MNVAFIDLSDFHFAEYCKKISHSTYVFHWYKTVKKPN